MTKKLSDISDEEKKLFRDAVAHVKPHNKFDAPETTQKIYKPVQIKLQKDFVEKKSTFFLDSSQPEIAGDTIISFSGSGLQNKKFTQLKQGKMRTEATLDLHKHTTDEALHAVENFLQHCQQKNFRTVCIIHGKGFLSVGNKPVLKNLLNNYLRAHPRVLAFHSAKNNQGGTGAIMVLLKA
ncbi:MAG TPA: Smr/MutS family protein [Coxiellaceae bacterium]|nr:MAG: hypothetical protein A3E81_01340 [Gammaproteobacteria bacterium RIFCSPHIGHO2_12_FULL_36_30]HLB56805.1 Smr/MutS family protein [Coxiellaceae bacterium]